jgi:hypothetical protein
MNNDEREIPWPQWQLFDSSLQHADAYELFLRRTFEPLHLQFDQVNSVIDLYCGNGTLTLGSILLFPNAQIHAIDYHRVLVSDAIDHPRVEFHQGWVTDVLADKSVPRADIVLMIFASRHHGFNKTNISLLSSHVGKYLCTAGDNANIEGEPWFRDTFDWLHTNHGLFSDVWKQK